MLFNLSLNSVSGTMRTAILVGSVRLWPWFLVGLGWDAGWAFGAGRGPEALRNKGEGPLRSDKEVQRCWAWL